MEGQQGTVTENAKPIGPIHVALDSLDGLANGLDVQIARFRTALDRLDGGAPDDQGVETAAPVPAGHIGRLQERVSDYERQITRLGDLVSRLEDLAE